MKIEKMKQLVKRLPNDGLFDLHEILIAEMNLRKEQNKNLLLPNIKMTDRESFIKSALLKELSLIG